MKKVIKRRNAWKSKLFKQCPSGGICMNPLCMFGCVESY